MSGPSVDAGLDRARRMRIGLGGYCRILTSVRDHSLNSEQVAAAVGVHDDMVRRVLRQLRAAGLVHREQWFRPKPHSRMLPRWRIGAAGDVPNPGHEPRTLRVPSSTLLTLLTVVEVLNEGPKTVNELAEEVGMHEQSIYLITKTMRNHRLLRIDHWVKPAMGQPAAAYAYCEVWKPDARRPATEPLKAQAKRWRATYYAKRAHMAMLKATAGATAPAANDDLRAA